MIESLISSPTYHNYDISFTLKKSTPYHLNLKEILTIIPYLYKDKSIFTISPFMASNPII